VVQLWDPRKLDEPMCNQVVDNMAGQLFPIYDEGSICCIISNRYLIIIYCILLLNKLYNITYI
jgi:hypothetical protein